MRIRHWQDVASLLLGVWLVLSPFALGFAGAAVWITIVLGLSVILLAVSGCGSRLYRFPDADFTSLRH